MRKPLFLILTLALALPVKAQDIDTERQAFFSNTTANQSGGMANTLLAMSVASIGAVLTETCVPQPGIIPGQPVVFPLSVIIFSNASRAYIGSEVQAATLHNADIEARNLVVQDLARRMRIQGGGDAQQITFVEAKKEREYLFAFTDMRELMITPLITGFNEAASQALDEPDVPENRIVCTGTLAAALVVAENLGIAFRASVGSEPAETILRSIGGVLEIVAAQILPMMETPSGRAIVAQIASEATSRISGELIAAKTGLETEITNIQTVISSFDSDLGVTPGSGLAVPRNAVLPQTNRPAQLAGTQTTTPSTGTTQTAGTAGASAVLETQGASPSATAGTKTRKCGEKKGKAFSFLEVCAQPVQVSEMSASRARSLTSKQVITESAKLVNALFKGEMDAAKVAATNLRGFSAAVAARKNRSAENLNARKSQAGLKALDLDTETKTQIAKMTTDIRKEITQRGGDKLLASTSTSVPRPQIKLSMPEAKTEDLPELSPRLRGKLIYNIQAAQASPKEASVTATPKTDVPAPLSGEPTLWERLTNRYRSNYGRFFEKKGPPASGEPENPGTQ